MIYSEEKAYREFGDELFPLAAVWSEQCGIDLCINWDSYMLIAEAGLLRTFSVREETGVLVGFAVFFLGCPLRENRVKRAQLDALYLHTTFRNGLTGYKFVKFCEEELTKDVTEVVFSVLPGFDYSKILGRLGYEPMETLHRKQVA